MLRRGSLVWIAGGGWHRNTIRLRAVHRIMLSKWVIELTMCVGEVRRLLLLCLLLFDPENHGD
jgi:hypothetical protein